MAKIFLTGATGYIGGEALHKIVKSKPDFQISCLVRDAGKGSMVKKAYPSVRIVKGDLDNTDLLEKEAKDADVVFHLASTGHLPSAKAILKGLSDKSRPRPGYWIQMSGATLVAGDEIKSHHFGEPPDKSYDDGDAAKVQNVITSNPGRVVDNLVISQESHLVRTALIAGPLIYGEGNGPVHKRSVQAPEITRVTLQRKKGFTLGKGLNVWSNVHIHDLGDFLAALLKAAVFGNSEAWNENGVYFPENGQMSFLDLSKRIVTEAGKLKLVESNELDEITAEEADSMSSHASVIWGTNAILYSSRAQAQLNWSPSGASLVEELPRLVRSEAENLGIHP